MRTARKETRKGTDMENKRTHSRKSQAPAMGVAEAGRSRLRPSGRESKKFGEVLSGAELRAVAMVKSQSREGENGASQQDKARRLGSGRDSAGRANWISGG